jgi:CheY-like chemotaxis protein
MEITLQPLLPAEAGGPTGKITVDRFPYVIGRRHASELRVSNPCVSRQHCRFFERDGRAWVEDLRSLNGTFVNEERLRGPRPLHDGDVIRVAYVVFKVRAPVTADEHTIVESNFGGSRPGGGRRVLVIEDDDSAAQSLSLILQAWGCRVRVAHDGDEALRAAREGPADAVLLDLRLPGMDGFEVARRLREEAGLETAKMVAMTGDPEAAGAEHAPDKGVQKVLMKPVRPDALWEVIGAP